MVAVESITETLWTYLTGGNFFQFFVTVFNIYFPFGMFFWLMGLVFFIVINLKTKSLGYGGAVASIYFVIITEIPGLVTNAYSQFGMRYFGLILAIISGYYLYKAWKG